MAQRFNLEERRAADAAKRETTAEPFELELPDGEVLELPTDPEGIPLAALEAFEEDAIAGFIKALLGADQWRALKRHDPKLSDLRLIAQGWTEAMGWLGGPSESPASGD